MSEADTIRKSTGLPVTVESLTADLRKLGLHPGMTVLVHSSLSQLGWVCGGPVAVVEALQAVLGPTSTLVMPTHSTDLSDPSHWVNPPVPEVWWQVIRDTMPPYDPAITPTRSMGAIVETFRKQPEVIRSQHPALSFAAWGQHAERITANHAYDYPMGDESPLARLYELDGHVLLLGVGHGNNTSLHLAEFRADFPAKKTTSQGAPVTEAGQRRWMTYDDIDWNDEDFPQIGEAFNATGQVTHGPVGYGEALLMRQRPLVDFAVHWMASNRQ